MQRRKFIAGAAAVGVATASGLTFTHAAVPDRVVYDEIHIFKDSKLWDSLHDRVDREVSNVREMAKELGWDDTQSVSCRWVADDHGLLLSSFLIEVKTVPGNFPSVHHRVMAAAKALSENPVIWDEQASMRRLNDLVVRRMVSEGAEPDYILSAELSESKMRKLTWELRKLGLA